MSSLHWFQKYNLCFTTTINTVSEVRVSKEVCRLEIPAKHFFGKLIERILQMHLRRLLALRYLKSLRKRKKTILLIKKFKLKKNHFAKLLVGKILIVNWSYHFPFKLTFLMIYCKFMWVWHNSKNSIMFS